MKLWYVVSHPNGLSMQDRERGRSELITNKLEFSDLAAVTEIVAKHNEAIAIADEIALARTALTEAEHRLELAQVKHDTRAEATHSTVEKRLGNDDYDSHR